MIHDLGGLSNEKIRSYMVMDCLYLFIFLRKFGQEYCHAVLFSFHGIFCNEHDSDIFPCGSMLGISEGKEAVSD